MGRVRNNRRKTSKSKEYKKAFKTDNRARDVDQIQEDLLKEKEKGAKMAFEVDDDLPGLGQFYCTPCGRHFFDQASLTSHADSRGHIRRYCRCTLMTAILSMIFDHESHGIKLVHSPVLNIISVIFHVRVD